MVQGVGVVWPNSQKLKFVGFLLCRDDARQGRGESELAELRLDLHLSKAGNAKNQLALRIFAKRSYPF